MSGVMLKTGVVRNAAGHLRLVRHPVWWWGLIPLVLGLFTAIYGVVFAAAQTDMKRLLAFSSIENIGILFTGVGLAIVFLGVGMTTLAALALIAVLYHAINHAFMKSLLFLGTGSVLHATGERNLGRLGGLIHRMPWVAWLTLIGALAIAGLPPLNGFVSEWLLLQAFLSAHEVPRTFVNMLLPLGAAVIALAAALAAYVMVKFFGVVFLGRPREAALAKAHDAGGSSAPGCCGWRPGCVALGLVPTQVIALLALVPEQLGVVEAFPTTSSWWHLVPVAGRQAAYAPLVFLLAIVATIVFTVCAGQRLLSPPGPAQRALGLRFRAARCAHAGHCGRFRPADSPHLPAVLRHAARAADAIRSRAAIPRRDRRPLLAGHLLAPRALGPTRCRGRRVAAAGTHRHLPAVQLRHLARAAGAGVMTSLHWLTQFLEVLAALAAAPLFVGWINQCRAWLQNKSAPPCCCHIAESASCFTRTPCSPRTRRRCSASRRTWCSVRWCAPLR